MKLRYIFIGILVFAVIGLGVALDASQRRERKADLRADNAEAVADTTRLLQVEVADSTAQVWQRRAEQREIERDALDGALGQETRARVDLEIQFAALQAEVTEEDSVAVTVDEDGTRTAEFVTGGPGWALTANVSLPEPPNAAVGSFDVRLLPLTLGVRIACLRNAVSGVVDPAVVDVTAPPWAQVGIESPVFDDEVCNPIPVRRPLFGLTLPGGFVAGATLGAAAAVLLFTLVF